MNPLFTQNIDEINQSLSVQSLESGQVLFFPKYYFSSLDAALTTDSLLDGKHKNVSYDYQKNKLGALAKQNKDLESQVKQMMRAYAEFAFELVQKALPDYASHLQWGRTSYRPAEIFARTSSKRKDDTKLHVDSFSASPVNGLRILRVFCNVNPHNEPRVWHVGEPFDQVLEQFASKIPSYSRLKARFLNWIKVTKTLRSPYDHCMLHLHDGMKCDPKYQAKVEKHRVDFPAQSSWIVFTDHVSHAALSGRYLLEQTFYLAVTHMANPKCSPLHQLQAQGLILAT